MGGHGGLNILPQKRWNVYNFDNREKVRKDEEAAAKEEQIKREQSRKRDAEFRLQKLRLAKGIPDPSAVETKSNHINLFQGLKVFPSLGGIKEDEGPKRKKFKKVEEAPPKVVSAEDEKYRLGYGIAGKGVKAPWYLSKPSNDEGNGTRGNSGKSFEEKKISGKKTLEELREERLKREKGEKERELALIRGKNKQMDLSKSKVRHFS
ncbi:hypothetical protein ACHQM5_024540 [Ranunculus cassubicifolius]